MWERIRDYLVRQSRDPATWRGFVSVGVGTTGWAKATADDRMAMIVFAGVFIGGLLEIIWPPRDRGDKGGGDGSA